MAFLYIYTASDYFNFFDPLLIMTKYVKYSIIWQRFSHFCKETLAWVDSFEIKSENVSLSFNSKKIGLFCGWLFLFACFIYLHSYLLFICLIGFINLRPRPLANLYFVHTNHFIICRCFSNGFFYLGVGFVFPYPQNLKLYDFGCTSFSSYFRIDKRICWISGTVV